MSPLAVTRGALAKIVDGDFEDGQRCTLQVDCKAKLETTERLPLMLISGSGHQPRTLAHIARTTVSIRRYGTSSPWRARQIGFG